MGNTSCFHNEIQNPVRATLTHVGPGILNQLFATIQQRKKDMPSDSYTTELFKSGIDRIAQKVIEEAGETALASVGSNQENTISEISDLLYHLLVMMSHVEITPENVWAELKNRTKED